VLDLKQQGPTCVLPSHMRSTSQRNTRSSAASTASKSSDTADCSMSAAAVWRVKSLPNSAALRAQAVRVHQRFGNQKNDHCLLIAYYSRFSKVTFITGRCRRSPARSWANVTVLPCITSFGKKCIYVYENICIMYMKFSPQGGGGKRQQVCLEGLLLVVPRRFELAAEPEVHAPQPRFLLGADLQQRRRLLRCRRRLRSSNRKHSRIAGNDVEVHAPQTPPPSWC